MPNKTPFTVSAKTSPQAGVVDLADVNLGDLALQSSDAIGVNLALTSGFFVLEFAQDGITANAAGTQAGATQLIAQTSRVATVAAAGNSVKLPAAVAGLELVVINHGANPMQVYGTGTDTINDVATTTGVSQMQNSTVIYTCTTAGAWYSEGLATGYSAGFATQSATDAISAVNPGSQSTATLLTSQLNRVVTVPAAASGVKLPAAAAGLWIIVIDAHASNAINVYPSTGDQINALGANAAFSVAATKTCQFYSTVAGQWHSLLSA